jgi:hypothetical protein
MIVWGGKILRNDNQVLHRWRSVYATHAMMPRLPAPGPRGGTTCRLLDHRDAGQGRVGGEPRLRPDNWPGSGRGAGEGVSDAGQQRPDRRGRYPAEHCPVQPGADPAQWRAVGAVQRDQGLPGAGRG